MGADPALHWCPACVRCRGPSGLLRGDKVMKSSRSSSLLKGWSLRSVVLSSVALGVLVSSQGCASHDDQLDTGENSAAASAVGACGVVATVAGATAGMAVYAGGAAAGCAVGMLATAGVGE